MASSLYDEVATRIIPYLNNQVCQIKYHMYFTSRASLGMCNSVWVFDLSAILAKGLFPSFWGMASCGLENSLDTLNLACIGVVVKNEINICYLILSYLILYFEEKAKGPLFFRRW